MQALAYGETRKNKRRFVYALVGLLVIMFVLFPVIFLTGLWSTTRDEKAKQVSQVIVPNIVGLDQHSAETLLKEKGLHLEVMATRSHPDAPPGTILTQSPPAGESALGRQMVSVVVSRGP